MNTKYAILKCDHVLPALYDTPEDASEAMGYYQGIFGSEGLSVVLVVDPEEAKRAVEDIQYRLSIVFNADEMYAIPSMEKKG